MNTSPNPESMMLNQIEALERTVREATEKYNLRLMDIAVNQGRTAEALLAQTDLMRSHIADDNRRFEALFDRLDKHSVRLSAVETDVAVTESAQQAARRSFWAAASALAGVLGEIAYRVLSRGGK